MASSYEIALQEAPKGVHLVPIVAERVKGSCRLVEQSDGAYAVQEVAGDRVRPVAVERMREVFVGEGDGQRVALVIVHRENVPNHIGLPELGRWFIQEEEGAQYRGPFKTLADAIRAKPGAGETFSE